MKIIAVVSCQNCPYHVKDEKFWDVHTEMKCFTGETIPNCPTIHDWCRFTGVTIPNYPTIPDWCPLPDDLDDKINKYEILLREIKDLKRIIVKMDDDKKV